MLNNIGVIKLASLIYVPELSHYPDISSRQLLRRSLNQTSMTLTISFHSNNIYKCSQSNFLRIVFSKPLYSLSQQRKERIVMRE